MSEGMRQKMLGLMIAIVIVARVLALTGTTTPQTSNTIENEKTNERNEMRLSNDGSVTEQPRGPCSSVDISDGTHSQEFREFTIETFGSITESNTQDGQVDDFQTLNYECCSDFECDSMLGLNSYCACSRFKTDLVCSASKYSPRKKRDLDDNDDNDETTIHEPVPTSSGDNSLKAGICACVYGFININSSCQFDFVPTSRPNTFATADSSIQTSSSASVNELCNEQLCSRGECGRIRRPDKFICNSLIDDLKCYVAKQCVADDFIYIFSCEDPCLNMTTSSPYSCYSEFCTTPLCNSNSTLVDDFRCSTTGVIYVSTYLWVLMLLCYVNNGQL